MGKYVVRVSAVMEVDVFVDANSPEEAEKMAYSGVTVDTYINGSAGFAGSDDVSVGGIAYTSDPEVVDDLTPQLIVEK